MLIFLSAMPAYAYDVRSLVFSIGSSYAPPYWHGSNDSILRSVGFELAKKLQLRRRFHVTPVEDVYQRIYAGRENIVCFVNPDWSPEEQHRLHWSPKLFQEQELLVTTHRENALQITSIADLHGKRLGTIKAYEYVTISEALATGKIQRLDVASLARNFDKLDLGRIDVLVDESIAINYYIQQQQKQLHYRLHSGLMAVYDLHCAYAKSLPKKRINAAFQYLIDKGIIEKIMAPYRLLPSPL